MRAVVVVASRHGGTREIGEVVASTLTEAGIECDVHSPDDELDLAPYDVVVVGSPVYTGRWLPEAREFVEAHVEELRARKVWMFSSGLSDAPAKASNRPAETQERLALVDGVAHRHFSGRLDLNVLNFAERAIIAAARGKQGDRRDMDAVRAWARDLAARVGASA